MQTDLNARRVRVLRRAAVAIVCGLVLGVAAFFAAGWLRLAAVFAVPMVGAFGATGRDLNFTPEQYAAFEARAHSLRASAIAVTYLSLALVAASGIATAWCGWQTRAEVKRWHWLSFLGLACVWLLVILANWIAISKPAMLGLLALDAVAVACAVIDLGRRQYGAPGRVVTWATGVLSVGVGALLWTDALGPNGVIGRSLRHG